MELPRLPLLLITIVILGPRLFIISLFFASF